MKFSTIKLSNFGPIKSGVIGNEKITVFFGPNNSGKSMTSKLIHAISSFDPNESKKMTERFKIDIGPITTEKMALAHIARSMGLPLSQIKTCGETICNISIVNSKNTIKIKIPLKIAHSMILYQHLIFRNRIPTKSSLYIPASRTGIIQFFTNITQMRSNLLNDMLSAFSTLREEKQNVSPKELKRFLESTGSLPASMNEFYDMVLDAYAKGITDEFQELFKDLFAGQIILSKLTFMQSLMFQDDKGVAVKIEDAGSGVLSSFPILLGIPYVKNGGSLIIEEPEAHMEPIRQFKLMEQLWQVSKERKIHLHFTTHSDTIIKKLLSMVSQKILKPSELGLYYFDREKGKSTTIKKMPVDKDGNAEQPIFDQAMDAMVDAFSK